jgi:hypothetical protein
LPLGNLIGNTISLLIALTRKQHKQEKQTICFIYPHNKIILQAKIHICFIYALFFAKKELHECVLEKGGEEFKDFKEFGGLSLKMRRHCKRKKRGRNPHATVT